MLSNGRIVVMALLLSFLGSGLHADPLEPGAKKRILFVFREAYKERPVDEKIKHRLDSLGYQVTFIDAGKPAVTEGYDLVIISANVSARALGDKYANVKMPVFMWESDIQDDMRYTGKHREVDFGKGENDHYIWITNAPHPMAGGIAAGTNVVFNEDHLIGWGKPGLGAAIIAILPGQPDKAIIYGYEKGATMDYDYLAPARRVMFLLNNTTFPNLTDTGLVLFDSCIAWAIGNK